MRCLLLFAGCCMLVVVEVACYMLSVRLVCRWLFAVAVVVVCCCRRCCLLAVVCGLLLVCAVCCCCLLFVVW